MIREYSLDGLKRLLIGNDLVEAVFLPQIGSKMISLVNKTTGTEFLLENQNKDKVYKQAYHGADYSLYDASGFDECFPTIEAAELIVKNRNSETKKILYPDHGELWSKTWDYELLDDSIFFTVEGVQADYRITKIITLKENSLIINYSLINNSEFPLNYIWSAHPLLVVDEGDRIILPPGINKLLLNWVSDGKIGKYGEYMPWTGENGDVNNFYHVKAKETGVAIKGFTDSLRYGFAGLYRPRKNESIVISFDNNKLPYLGVWLCFGGWPVGSARKHYTVALEPTTGRPDSLSESVKRNECPVLEVNAERNWQIEFSLWEGIPEI